ncbi:hypothetical protein ABZS52_29975 [Micromonospora profundi]|uniref:hypothetical protein n=1 Tax=Micromonospora profundi TaxID=1420889 RepID=UPI0033ABECC2
MADATQAPAHRLRLRASANADAFGSTEEVTVQEALAAASTGVVGDRHELDGATPGTTSVKRELIYHGWCDFFAGWRRRPAAPVGGAGRLTASTLDGLVGGEEGAVAWALAAGGVTEVHLGSSKLGGVEVFAVAWGGGEPVEFGF